MHFWVYHNWCGAATHARVHLETCRHCNNGTGQNKPKREGKWDWVRFNTYERAYHAAEVFLRNTPAEGTPINCKICHPERYSE